MRHSFIACLMLLWCPFMAQAATFQQGIHYQQITPAQTVHVERPQQIEVVELFWYGCQTCFMIQSSLQDWLQQQGDRVAFRRVPAMTGQHMGLLARAYYAGEALGVNERIHARLYHAIHREQRKLDNEAALRGFYAENGISGKRFDRAFGSSFASSRVRRARAMSRRYGIRGAPSLIINGRYRIDASMVNSVSQMMEVAGYLVDMERKAGPQR